MSKSGRVVWTVVLGVMVFGVTTVWGQSYPNKPVRIVTGAAGGGADLIARMTAEGISGPLGQPVIVDNRAGGTVTAMILYESPPDGYTLLMTGSTLWVSPLLRKTPYDAIRDFTPVSYMTREVSILAVNPAVPAKSVKELIALAKAKPGELNYATSTVGGPAHLSAELFKSMAGINIVHIPYKGGAAAIAAVMSGEAQITIFDSGVVAPHVKSGKLRALAVSSASPSTLAPGLPTIAASGLPGYESTGMTVLVAPGKTPKAVIGRLNQEIVRFLNKPEVKERLLSLGEETVASSPEQAAVEMKADLARMAKVIKDANIKVE